MAFGESVLAAFAVAVGAIAANDPGACNSLGALLGMQDMFMAVNGSCCPHVHPWHHPFTQYRGLIEDVPHRS